MTTTTTTKTMTKALASATTKARSAITRQSTARYALATVLASVKSSGLASDYLTKAEAKALGQGQTAFSAWYQRELGLTDSEVTVLTQWVFNSEAIGHELTIGHSKALASVPERHDKTKAENIGLVYDHAKTDGKGKATEAKIRKARKALKLEAASRPSKAKAKAETKTETVLPPVAVGVTEAMNLLLTALGDITDITKAEARLFGRITKALGTKTTTN